MRLSDDVFESLKQVVFGLAECSSLKSRKVFYDKME